MASETYEVFGCFGEGVGDVEEIIGAGGATPLFFCEAHGDGWAMVLVADFAGEEADNAGWPFGVFYHDYFGKIVFVDLIHGFGKAFLCECLSFFVVII